LWPSQSFAFGYLNAARMRHLMQQGATRSQALAQVLHNPGPFLSSIGLLYLLSVAATTLVAFEFAMQLIHDVVWRVVALVIVALLALSVQIVARSIASVKPERAAVLLYGPLRIVGIITGPLVRPWFSITEMLVRRIPGARA
jgi:Mg2+/Co2+ transporter CorB